MNPSRTPLTPPQPSLRPHTHSPWLLLPLPVSQMAVSAAVLLELAGTADTAWAEAVAGAPAAMDALAAGTTVRGSRMLAAAVLCRLVHAQLLTPNQVRATLFD
jgi:hypothetical protein